MIKKETYKAWYSAMDAVNSGALIDHFSRYVLPEIRQEQAELKVGTDFTNSHPLVVLLADKLIQLAHCNDVLDAYRFVQEGSEGKL